MKIKNITLETTDIKGTITFYTKILGLDLIKFNENSAIIKIGESTLSFIKNDSQEKPIYHFAFNIPSNKLFEAIEWSKDKLELIKENEDIIISNFEKWNANSVYFYDNNGNLLEFIARKDINNNSIEPFGANQILNISEIGIVVEKPDEYGKYLIEKYNLHLFEKNDNNSIFTAIGDDEGLLIIVIMKRNWYPTQISSKSYKTEIELINKENRHIIQIE